MTTDRAAVGVAHTSGGDADREELARRLCRGLYELWLRQQSEPATDTAEGRAPHPDSARPPRSDKEERGVPTTGPAHILHHT